MTAWMSISILVDLDRTQKICIALNDKDSLLKYFANEHVELIPEVLALPHGRIVNEHKYKHLNIVYSIVILLSDNCAKSDAKRKRVD